MKRFKQLLIGLVILSGCYMIGDLLFGFEQYHPDTIWFRLPKVILPLSILVYYTIFLNEKK